MEARNFDSSKIVEATTIFFQVAQNSEIDRLYDQLWKQDLHSPTELSKTIEAMTKIDSEGLSAESQQKLQSLFGRVHHLNLDNMVNSIVDEAQALSRGDYASTEELAQRTNGLKGAMAELWHNHTLSEENCQFLKIATQTLAHLTITEPNAVQEERPEKVLHDPEIAFELFEIAQLLYEGKVQESSKLFSLLPNSIKATLGELKPTPSFIEKLIKHAFKISRMDGYLPSRREIQMILEEAHDIKRASNDCDRSTSSSKIEPFLGS